jgi:hypothetical protein
VFREESEQICNIKVNDQETMMYRVCTESIIMKFYIVLKIIDVRRPALARSVVRSVSLHIIFLAHGQGFKSWMGAFIFALIFLCPEHECGRDI